MKIRLLSNAEAAYRTYAICIFFKFGIIDSETALDFIQEKILIERSILLPPFNKPLSCVELTKKGTTLRKSWVENSGLNVNGLHETNDPYLDNEKIAGSKFLMSEKRIQKEIKQNGVSGLIKLYDFEVSELLV